MGQVIEVGSLYDLNKQIIKTLPPQSEAQLKEGFLAIGAWFGISKHPSYFMLMCKEISDFTLIHLNDLNFTGALQELKELLDERGTVHSIQYIHGEDAFEIWVKDEKHNEVYMYMLFNADWMVVEV